MSEAQEWRRSIWAKVVSSLLIVFVWMVLVTAVGGGSGRLEMLVFGLVLAVALLFNWRRS